MGLERGLATASVDLAFVLTLLQAAAGPTEQFGAVDRVAAT